MTDAIRTNTSVLENIMFVLHSYRNGKLGNKKEKEYIDLYGIKLNLIVSILKVQITY